MPVCGLFESYYADNECNRVDGRYGQFEWIVFLVVGYDEDVVLVMARLYALDEGALVGVDDIYLVPLEEEARH